MKVAIIGGGASGMTAAIVAARGGYEVTIFEYKDRVGKKLLATGNGRCNLSNKTISDNPQDVYLTNEKEFVKSIFNKFSFEDTMEFFSKLGLMFKFRGDLVYPNSDQASSVLDALRYELRDLGVKVLCNHKVEEIRKSKGGFLVFSENVESLSAEKEDEFYDKVILTTGSKAQPALCSDGFGYRLAKDLGHKITSVTPGLVSFVCEGKFFKELAGVRVPARLSLCEISSSGESVIYSESGELQLTNYGVSGIAAMNLSNRMNLIHDKAFINIDLLEEMNHEDVKEMLQKRIEQFGYREAGELLNGVFPKKLANVLLKLSDIPLDGRVEKITEKQREHLLSNIKDWKVKIIETNKFDSAQICLGGVRIDEIKDNMESRIVPGLFFAGEILDLHGDCGGFNLQLAWTTGAIAGKLGEEA